jgi:glycosyltransferase involved in cell wall biosynthesis
LNIKTQISLVCTVRDEADNIADLLDSMLAQTRPATEIVINDCGSRDATAAIVERYIAAGHPIKLVAGGHNIPSGRNNAILHAQYPIIACTDAGLTLDPHWLARIVEPIEQDKADIVGGFYTPAPRSFFELVLGATNYREVDEIDPTSFLPFGQSVAFRKSVWEKVGGYPEWASHCEDLIFAFALKRHNVRFDFAPSARVNFRPRSNLKSFARQYYNYSRGDGIANLWPKRHAIRYGMYLGLLGILGLSRRYPWLLALPLLGAYGYSRKPWQRLIKRAPKLTTEQKIQAAALIPTIRLVGDVAKMIGYPQGIMQRKRSYQLHRAIDEYQQQ